MQLFASKALFGLILFFFIWFTSFTWANEVGKSPATPDSADVREDKLTPPRAMQPLLKRIDQLSLLDHLDRLMAAKSLEEIPKEGVERWSIPPPPLSADAYRHNIILHPSSERFWVIRSRGIAGHVELFQGEIRQLDEWLIPDVRPTH